jgi:hypothetical protein
MANTNFVVHNGLSVGPTTIDAASGNVTIPVGKHITIGNVLLRDNGQGRLAVRDITDNSDAIIDATVDAGSTTSGNIQIGTNHIESTNANGAISLRPNGSGNIALAANTIMVGKGGAFTLIGTGIQTDATLGINYTPSNIIVQTDGALSSGNVRVSMTTPSTSRTTGALQVMGGVGINGALFVGSNMTVEGNLTVNGNTTTINANNLTINDSMIFLAEDNPADTIDIGFVGHYSSPGLIHTGLVRDATDSIWKLFSNVAANPTTTVDFTNAIYSPLLSGTHTIASGFLNVGGNILATGGILNSLTVNGNVTVTTAYVMPSANAASSLGTSAARWNFIYGVNGNFLSVNANYADLAEKYVADAEYAPGTVLMFGGDKEVTQCVHDMCSRVAGVVSTNPAYLMNSGLEGEYTVELALTGRVPTKVRGPVRKGDLMVSAGEGYARTETLPQVGTVIGKALEDFNGDSGVIEVVVGKH